MTRSDYPNYQINAKMNLHLKKMNTNLFWFDKFLEPVVVVSHTRKNYFDWALSDWAIKANVWVLTFGPLCIKRDFGRFLKRSFSAISLTRISGFWLNLSFPLPKFLWFDWIFLKPYKCLITCYWFSTNMVKGKGGKDRPRSSGDYYSFFVILNTDSCFCFI